MNTKTKFFVQFCTIIFSTISSIFETSLLYRAFNLEILGTFFIIQSSTLLLFSLFSVRIVESTQVALNKYGIKEYNSKNYYSKLYAFYIITLVPILPLSLILIIFFRNVYEYNLESFLISVLLIVLTNIVNKLKGFWYAYQFYMNSSQNISLYEIFTKCISILLIFILFLLSPEKNQVTYISTIYFLRSIIFFIYELTVTSKLLNSSIFVALRNPISTFKTFIYSESSISNSIKSSYLRNILSSVVKNGDIAVAGLIAGPSGSSLLKIIKSIPTIILQPSQYITNFAISYINKSSKKYSEIFNNFTSRSLKLIPFALIISIIFSKNCDPFFNLVYQVNLTNSQNLILSILLFLSFFILLFSWSAPLHIFRNQYGFITLNSFIGSGVSIILLAFGLLFRNPIYVYFSLIFGIFATFVLNTISHIYKIKNLEKSKL
tara:strand:+ start:531 stop:1832 length:1302 start_codon:yes stop_codon:yes gene_type:complete